MVSGVQKLKNSEKVCEGCKIGKHHREAFKSGRSWRASETLELVHTDVCGPMQTATMSENRYFLLFY